MNSENPFRALSWGCGLQSTALAVMSALGDLPRLDLVLHADLGWERKRTVEVREFYTAWLRERGLRVEILDVGDIRELGAKEHVHMPFWTSDGGPLQRQCTREFKVRPAKRRIREILGYHPSRPPAPPAGAVEQWIGISLDEWERMKDSGVQFIRNRWPLIELRMSRNDCADYLEAQGLPVPVKSACVGCPYRRASEWLEMRGEAPEEFEEAVAFDEVNRCNPLAERGASTADELFIYADSRSGPAPLAEADLEEAARREREGKQLPLVMCDEGHCWV
jgi:hypothetical protein